MHRILDFNYIKYIDWTDYITQHIDWTDYITQHETSHNVLYNTKVTAQYIYTFS